MRRLVDRYEEIVLNEISDVGSRYGLSAYPKVRVADVIELDALSLNFELKRFGLMAHFDFVVCREYVPQYAVEFDGQSHLSSVQKLRDAKKDHLCQLADLPILRINSKYLTGNFGHMSLLAWIMETYELQRGFFEAQESGQIPYDEPFDPFFLMILDEGKLRYPLWLSRNPRLELRRWHEERRVEDFGTCGIHGNDVHETLRGLEFVRVTPSEGLFVETAMRGQRFPILFSDLLDEILFIQLMQRLRAHFSGNLPLTPLSEIYDRCKAFRSKYRVAVSHWIGHGSDEIAA